MGTRGTHVTELKKMIFLPTKVWSSQRNSRIALELMESGHPVGVGTINSMAQMRKLRPCSQEEVIVGFQLYTGLEQHADKARTPWRDCLGFPPAPLSKSRLEILGQRLNHSEFQCLRREKRPRMVVLLPRGGEGHTSWCVCSP